MNKLKGIGVASTAISLTVVSVNAWSLAYTVGGACPGDDEPVRDDRIETYRKNGNLGFFMEAGVNNAMTNWSAAGTDFI